MFRFKQKTEVIFGENTLAELPQALTTRKLQKVFVVGDPGVEKAGIIDQVNGVLKECGITFINFNRIEANPTDETIIQAAELCKSEQCDVVIGVGGGSPMDAAKAIAMLATNDQPLINYCEAGVDPWDNTPLPIIAIPTTAGTGAEVSGAAMINVLSQHRKVDIFGPSITPEIAIADPQLTIGLPPHLTATTGLDAFSHALEAYVTKGANPVTDNIVTMAIQLFADNIRQAFANGENMEARSNMMLASTLAVAGCAGLGCVHSIAQSIGGFYNLPHGLAISVCLPACSEFNIFAAPGKYAHVARILGVNTKKMNEIEAAKSVIPAMRQLLIDLEITDTLTSLGVKENDIDVLAKNSLKDGSTPGNPRPLTEACFKKIIGNMLAE